MSNELETDSGPSDRAMVMNSASFGVDGAGYDETETEPPSSTNLNPQRRSCFRSPENVKIVTCATFFLLQLPSEHSITVPVFSTEAHFAPGVVTRETSRDFHGHYGTRTLLSPVRTRKRIVKWKRADGVEGPAPGPDFGGNGSAHLDGAQRPLFSVW
jgi:hypothetical protein